MIDQKHWCWSYQARFDRHVGQQYLATGELRRYPSRATTETLAALSIDDRAYYRVRCRAAWALGQVRGLSLVVCVTIARAVCWLRHASVKEVHCNIQKVCLQCPTLSAFLISDCSSQTILHRATLHTTDEQLHLLHGILRPEGWWSFVSKSNVLQSMVDAFSLVRDKNGACPDEVEKTIEVLVRLNENEDNEVS